MQKQKIQIIVGSLLRSKHETATILATTSGDWAIHRHVRKNTDGTVEVLQKGDFYLTHIPTGARAGNSSFKFNHAKRIVKALVTANLPSDVQSDFKHLKAIADIIKNTP